jgi:hypothetical protein
MGVFDGGTNEIKSSSKQTKFQKDLEKKTKKATNKYWDKTGKKGVQLPETSLVEPFDPMQALGQEMSLAAVPGMQNIADAGSAYTTKLLASDPSQAGRGSVLAKPGYDQAALDFLMGKVLYPESNPALQGAIDAAVRPITEQLTTEQLPAIRGDAVTSGNFGSSRQGIAEGLASGQASTAIGDTSANLANEGYQAGLNAMTTTFGNVANADTARYGTQQGALSNLYNTNVNSQLNALGLLPQTQGSLLTPALTTSAVGDVRQGEAQAQRDENVYRDLFKQTSPLTSAQSLTSLANAQRGGTSTTTQDLPDTDPILGTLGAAGTAATVFPNLGDKVASWLNI